MKKEYPYVVWEGKIASSKTSLRIVRTSDSDLSVESVVGKDALGKTNWSAYAYPTAPLIQAFIETLDGVNIDA